jgi:hypothetical protein
VIVYLWLEQPLFWSRARRGGKIGMISVLGRRCRWRREGEKVSFSGDGVERREGDEKGRKVLRLNFSIDCIVLDGMEDVWM